MADDVYGDLFALSICDESSPNLGAGMPGTVMWGRECPTAGNPGRLNVLRTLTAGLVAFLMAGCATQVPVGVPTAKVATGTGLSLCYDGEAIRLEADFDGEANLVQSAEGKQAAFVGEGAGDNCGAAGSASRPHGFSLGRPDIQYQGGNADEREATIVDDPAVPANRVLQFWLRHANVRDGDGRPLKGRVQMNVYGSEGVRRAATKVRMYLPADFNRVLSYPGKMEWLTISEWWNNAGWTSEAYPFRISVNLAKEGSGPAGRFVFKAHAQALDATSRRWRHTVWEEINRSFAVPVGKWVTLEYGFEEGDQKTGRFFMAATPEGGGRVVVFDVRGYTHHPDDAAPDGLSHWNPIKLYTSAQLIDHVRAQGGALQVFWDDLSVVVCPKKSGSDDDACSTWR
jgi:hypothetical protein